MRKDCINRELTLEWIVGTFMFLILLALGYFTIIIGSDNLFRRTHPIQARFENVSGLRKGDNVTLQGMAIGKVADLMIEDDFVLVSGALDTEITLYEDYRIEILETSVLGGRQLRIDRGTSAMPPVPPGTILQGTPPIDLMAEAATVVRDVRVALTDGGILEHVSEAVADLNRVAGRLSRGEGTLGALLADDAAYRDLIEITGRLSDSAGRFDGLLAGLERGEGTLGQLLQDDAIGHGLRDALADISAITADLRAGEGTLGRLLKDDAIARDLEAVLGNLRSISDRVREGEGSLGKLLADDATLFDDLAQTIASLRAVALKIEQGEGSLGQLIVDDGLYRRAITLIDEIRATVDDFRESTPLTTFSSILFGAL